MVNFVTILKIRSSLFTSDFCLIRTHTRANVHISISWQICYVLSAITKWLIYQLNLLLWSCRYVKWISKMNSVHCALNRNKHTHRSNVRNVKNAFMKIIQKIIGCIIHFHRFLPMNRCFCYSSAKYSVLYHKAHLQQCSTNRMHRQRKIGFWN